MGTFQVFDPTTEAQQRTLTYAPRPDSLRNMRIGLIENTKFNSDQLLRRIGTILEQEYGAKSSIMRSKHNSSVPAHQEILDEFDTACDVVIAGVGD